MAENTQSPSQVTSEEKKRDEAIHITPLDVEATHAFASWMQQEFAPIIASYEAIMHQFHEAAQNKPEQQKEIENGITDLELKLASIRTFLQSMRTANVANINNSAGKDTYEIITAGDTEKPLTPGVYSFGPEIAEKLVTILRHTIATPFSAFPLMYHAFGTDAVLKPLGSAAMKNGKAITGLFEKISPEQKIIKELRIGVTPSGTVSMESISQPEKEFTGDLMQQVSSLPPKERAVAA